MLITNLLSRYVELCKEAFAFCSGAKLNKSIQSNIIEMLLLMMTVARKVNFTQMGRYGKRCEQCYRQTAERSMDWLTMNSQLVSYAFGGNDGRRAIAIDPSYIKKSGKHTPHAGMFWSGCAGAVKYGLEILGIGVIDVDRHDCMMLKAVQTSLDESTSKDEMSLYDWYAKVLEDDKEVLQHMAKVLVADSAFSKKPFINKMLGIGFHVVSRLRRDAALYYLWDGKPTGKRGRPRVKGEKIDLGKLDKTKAQSIAIEGHAGQMYALNAWCKSLRREISLVIHLLPNGGHRLYFSTDKNMTGRDVIEFYCTRFQIEFCFRDAKQFVGLTDCQARDERKLDFAFNSSFTAVNVAKIMCKEYGLTVGRLKALMVNAYYAQRFIDAFKKTSNEPLNPKIINEIFGYAAEAA